MVPGCLRLAGPKKLIGPREIKKSSFTGLVFYMFWSKNLFVTLTTVHISSLPVLSLFFTSCLRCCGSTFVLYRSGSKHERGSGSGSKPPCNKVFDDIMKHFSSCIVQEEITYIYLRRNAGNYVKLCKNFKTLNQDPAPPVEYGSGSGSRRRILCGSVSETLLVCYTNFIFLTNFPFPPPPAVRAGG